jgi:hypothetical protein
MEEMKRDIAKILAAVEYQGKLIEEIYQVLDENRKTKAQVLPNLSALMQMIESLPGLKNNPVLADMMRNMFAGLEGGRRGH